MPTPLTIHLGFMPEELSAKLKPDIKAGLADRSILIITREDVGSTHELFEQDIRLYGPEMVSAVSGLEHRNSGKTLYQCARSFQRTSRETDSDCKHIIEALESSMRFDVSHVRLEGNKAKLPDGYPKLTVIKVGKGPVSDIYLQFPEMGFQSPLATKLVKKIIDALFSWIEDHHPGEYDHIHCDAFGAGGSLNETLKPGSKNEVKGVLSIRRSLKDSGYQSICSLDFFNPKDKKEPLVLFETAEVYADQYRTKLDIDRRVQEAARIFILDLAFGIDNDPSTHKLSSVLTQHLEKSQAGYRKALNISKKLKEEAKKLFRKLRTNEKKSQDTTSILLDEETNTLNKRARKVMAEIENTNKTLAFLEEAEIENIRKLAQMECNDEKYRDKIQKIKDRIKQENVGEDSISCSASFFIDSEVKKAIRSLLRKSAGDANMEDDFLIEVKNYLQRKSRTLDIPFDFQCSRVHCDPFNYTPVKKMIAHWAAEKTCGIDYYIDAIIWGVSGFEKDYLTKNADWDLDLDDLDNPENYFYSTKNSEGREIIIDPCWREIGTDFLANIINKKAFTEYFSRNHNDHEKNNFVSRAKALDKALKEVVCSKKLEELDVVKEKLRAFVSSFLKENGLEVEKSDRYQCWIRKGSWGGNSTQVLNELTMNGSNVDRALYVSTNIVALQDRGVEHLKELRKKTGLQPPLAVVTPDSEEETEKNDTKLVALRKELSPLFESYFLYYELFKIDGYTYIGRLIEGEYTKICEIMQQYKTACQANPDYKPFSKSEESLLEELTGDRQALLDNHSTLFSKFNSVFKERSDDYKEAAESRSFKKLYPGNEQ